MAVVNELVTRFSFIGNLQPQQNFNANLSSSIRFLAGFAAAIGTASLALGGMISNQLASINPLIQLRNETGMSANRLEHLTHVATLAGGSFEGMAQSLEGLNAKIDDAAMNGSETFARLGINVRGMNGDLKDAGQILNEVRTRFNQMNLSSQQRQYFGSALGIDSSTLKILSLSGAEYKKYNDQAARALKLTDAQVTAADKYNRSLSVLKLNLNGIRNQIAVSFAPQLTELSEKFINLINRNRDWIVRGITKTIEFIGRLTDMIVRLLPILTLVASAFVALRIASLGFATIMGFILSPVILITAGIVALLLILDDLIVAFNGGKSVIREFFQEWIGIDIVPIMKEIVKNVKLLIDDLKKLFEPLLAFFGGVFSAIINVFKGDFKGAILDIKNAFTALYEYIKALFSKPLLENYLPDWAITLLNGVAPIGAISNIQDIGAFLNDLSKTTMPMLPSSPFAAAGGGGNITQNNTVNVTSSDPVTAGRIAAERLQDQLTNADALLSRGGK